MRVAAPVGAMLLLLSGCGGGGGSSTGPIALPTGSNVAPVTVDSGPAGTVNTAFVSVTVCAPGTADCQTVDHVLVDTGSSGLRLVASVLPASFTLPALEDNAGNALAECLAFADGFAFGSVKQADVKIAGEQASALPIQLIGDAAFAAVPSDCSGVGPAEDTVQALGANGVLGLSTFREDCGSDCAASALPANYYSCPQGSCAPAAVPLASQVQNPVWRFPVDNNGSSLVMRSVDPAGAALVQGALVFGIDTQGNNALGSATVLGVDADTGDFTTLYKGSSLTSSFIDSGSNGLFFDDSALPKCPQAIGSDFYCPASVQSLTATLQSGGVNRDVPFKVANAQTLFSANTDFVAFGTLAGTAAFSGSFDWGLPFFYGRQVFVAIEGQSTAAGPGPFVAF